MIKPNNSFLKSFPTLLPPASGNSFPLSGDKNFKRHFHPAAPAVRLCRRPLSPAALAASPARSDGLPQRRAARRGAARRGLDRQSRRGEAEDCRVLRARGPRDGPSGKAGGRAGHRDSSALMVHGAYNNGLVAALRILLSPLSDILKISKIQPSAGLLIYCCRQEMTKRIGFRMSGDTAIGKVI